MYYNTEVFGRDITSKMHYKACTKCAGDMIFDSSWPGGALRCLQCGMTKELLPMVSEEIHSGDISNNKNKSDKARVA